VTYGIFSDVVQLDNLCETDALSIVCSAFLDAHMVSVNKPLENLAKTHSILLFVATWEAKGRPISTARWCEHGNTMAEQWKADLHFVS
jgi:hypothetical protein